uniref:Transposase (Putative), gypsy type n=1 Tax=Tanacetum cinerariifolium TaxID=118510 RepID=A0A699IIC2_TANCI|nr:hypothetical protein [Tanacetum cinerariifolium]
MTTSSGSILLLVWLPFHGIRQNESSYTLDEDTYPSFLRDDGTEMELSAFIHVGDPTKVKVAERERAEEEARLLDSIVRRVVSLLPVALARAESELETSVDRLFDEGGSADQGDSAVGGGQDAETKLVTGVKIIAAENVIAERAKCPRKKRQAFTDASGSFHPPKNLRGHRTSITSSVSATLKHESGAPDDSITRLNVRTIGPSERSVAPPPVMTEAVITTNIASIPSTPAPKTGTKWHVSNDTLLDDHDVSREFIDHLAPPVLFAQIREMDYHHLVTEFNVGTARQACLNAEVRMRTEYCLSGKRRLESECEKQADLLKARDAKVENLKAQLQLKETEAAEADWQNDGLVDQVHALETTCSGLYDQVAKLDVDLLEMALHLEEKFYPHILTTISRAIKKGMHDGLSVGIDHGKAEAPRGGFPFTCRTKISQGCKYYGCYGSAPLGRSSCNATGMSDLQPDVEQLTLPIHRPEDQVVLAQRSALIDVWVPLVDPLTAKSLIGKASTSNSVPAAVVTITAPSTTFASASSVLPITIEDYEIVGTDGPEYAQGSGQGNVASFPTVKFEKEELDTTSERDPPS